jgi:ligand-binding sensor domain-containing protein/DNA-binding CsgD family transcriptional regulator
MRIALRLFLALLLAGCTTASFSFSQIKGVGLPFMINHERNVYKASTQNWSIAQNNRGFMYFGNNDGILEYDGTSWNMYPLPNRSIVRSLYAKGDTIFAGAFETIGFLSADSSGQMSWKSLDHLIPAEFRNFDEVWKIYEHEGKIMFQSFQYVFIYDNQSIKVVKPIGSFSFMHKVRNNFYIVDRKLGLMQFLDDTPVLISNDDVFFKNDIVCIFPFSDTQMIFGTSNDGLFLWDGDDLTPWNNDVNDQLIQYNLFSGTSLDGGYYAFGSISNGVYITDSNGNLIQHINRIKGLQNNTILAIFQDRRNNLWLGLDNGIDYLEISSPLTILNHNFNIESAYASIYHNGLLYVGTNQGLFAASIFAASSPNPGMKLISGTEGQVWSLKVIDNTLFCGHNSGCFQINGFNARQVSDIRGFWSFIEIPGNKNIVLAGTYNGLVRLTQRETNWFVLDQISGFTESSREMFLDSEKNLWISHGYKGLFKLRFDSNFSVIEHVDLLMNEAGLPPSLPYNIHEVRGDMVVTVRDSILIYRPDIQSFVRHDDLSRLFEGKGFVDKIHQDQQGNLWYYTEEHLGLMRLLEDGTYRDITAPFTRINDFLLPAFQNIFVADAFNVFIGSQNGLVHYNSSIINDYNLPESLYFKDIAFYGKDEYRRFPQGCEEVRYNHDNIPRIPFDLNSVSFRFTSTVYENPESLKFSYQLKGFDSHWSDWDNLNFKEYTNLFEGNYIFELKALNSFGVESPVITFEFIVAPPLYRSGIAWAVYLILFLFMVASNIYFVRKRMLKIREREKYRHEKRMARQEQIFKEQTEMSEKEIMQLRNDGLKSEMNHKNKELANATLHLIQKNKTLTSLKIDLSKLLRNIHSDNAEKQIVNSLLKKVNKDLRNEKNWELFNNYFDDVHQDFISRLKENFSDLTPKELRLCAYLRMNLSTKEIAPLMNISVRGVEISRYRLRKKMKIEHDINLTEYLLSY